MKSKKTIFILIILTYVNVLFGQYVSVQNGNWSNGATWNTGTVPPSWGAYTVVINHNVAITGTVTGANWQLTVNPGGSLTEVGCQTVTTWDGNALWINFGTIDVYRMNGPGKVINYGTITVDIISQAHTNSRWVNTPGATINCVGAIFNGNADFINQGTFTASCTGVPCYASPSGWGLEFNGDSLVNTGTISTCSFAITSGTTLVNDVACSITVTGNTNANGCVWTNSGAITMGGNFSPSNLDIYNALGATISAAGNMSLSTGTTMTNYGAVSMDQLQLNASTITNYGTIDASLDLINNSGSSILNFGCNCFATTGTITVQGDLENYAYIDNNGLFTVNGTAVDNFGSMGATSCGKFQMPGTTIVADNSGLFFGVPIICAQALTCWGCQSDATVYWTCSSPPDNCDFNVILPIELINFSAHLNLAEDLVEINWETGSERGNNTFEVERSVNGHNWMPIDTVLGYGSSQISRKYATTDTTPVPGFSYYRLKFTDMNGEYTYSNIATVTYLTDDVFIFPNPANSMISISGIKYEPTDLVVYSVHGAVLNPPYRYDAASRMITMDISGLASGVYVVKLKDEYFQFVVTQP